MSSKERIGIILDVDAEVSKAQVNIKSLTKIFDGIGGSKGNQLRDILSDISAEYEKLANESGKTMSKVGDFTKAEKSSERLEQLLRRLNKEITGISRSSKSDLSKFFPPEVADRVKKASDAVKTYNTILDNSSKKKGAIGVAADEYEKQERAARKAAEALKDLQDIQKGNSKKQAVTSDVQAKKQANLTSANAEVKQYSKELEKAQKAMDEFKARKADLFERGTQNKSSEFRELRDNLQAAENNFKGATDKAAELRRELKNMVVVEDLDEDIKATEKALQDAQNAAEKLKSNLDNVTADELARAFDEAKKKLEGLSGIDLSEITNIDDLTNLLDRFTNEGVEGLVRSLSDAGVEIRELGNANDQVGAKIRDTTNDVEDQNRAMKDVSGLKTRILEFFSLTNAMQLARRGLQQTFETVKELDKAMTETAVVTDFSVGDMWDALPEYTKMANELGVATQGVYEASTLYYQQGLETNEVMALTSETLKMARIAGLDCAEATDLMTAALRGFNMEINETNAQRINDVYSELAAITAADTQEIATAMTKTASIASSANMEFETTAALLSQIIETTREPAETAGTAMKTIIARFTEMKKATSDLINVDGEVVSVNKVEDALASAGVALRDVNGEFRDLDDVFLELSSKWNSLDIMTQRYIATTAAGSRQQSRFIAMMQDYDRTVELVGAAYNSNGASANQFAKTQESLESKLAKLKNAWDEFMMGINDSKAIKLGVDALTGLLNIVNKLTGKSGILKLAVAIGALKGGAAIFNNLFKSLSKQGFSLESIGARIKNFKQTGSFSLKGTTDSQLASKQLTTAATSAAKTQVSGATSAAKVQVEGATKAGQILIKGATEAAKIEAKGAKTENTIEQKGAEVEGAKENADAVAEGIKEQKSAEAEGVQENTDAVVEGTTENAGATSEVAIEKAGAAAEVVVENAGATAETAIEVSGAVVEETIEAGGSDGNNKDSNFLEQGSTWKDGFGKMWGNFKKGATAAFAAIKPLLPLIAALAAEVAILSAVWYFSDEQVETRKLEEANKLAEGLSNGLEDARSALKSVTDGRSGLQSLKDELNGLTVGTDEWKLKLLEVQAEEAKLIEQFDLKESMPDLENPELKVNGLIQIDSAGNQTITEKGWEYLEKRQEDTVKTNLAASQIAQASAERQEFELEKVQALEEKEDEVAKGDNVVGGVTGGVLGTGLGVYGGMVGYSLGIAGAGAATSALSGTALGAKLGGALGSVVPGLGTVIGVAVGALAGAAIGYAVNEVVEEIGGHGDEYKKAEAQLQKEQRIADQKQYMAYKNALKQTYSENKNLTTEEAEVAAAINASNMDQFIAAAEDEVGKKANKDEQKLWAEYKGYTWKDNKAYDADGNEVDLSDKKAIAKELAIFKAMDAAEQNAEVIAKYLQQGGEAIRTLSKDFGSSYEDFSKILSGDISANKETVDYMAENAENNVDMAEKILEEAKTDEEKIQAIAAFTGKSEEDIRKEGKYIDQMAEALRVKALETQLNQLYAAQDFYAEMVYSGVASMDENGELVYSAEIDVDGLDDLDEKLSYEQMESILKISEGLRNALGKEGAGSKALYEALDTMTEDQIKETISIFEGIDFSNPIRGANALNKALNSNEEAVRGLGQELLSISGDQYSIGSQFDYLMTSGIYDGFTEDIKELMEENGKLSAKNIREMAESSEELAMFLDQDGVSAHGLAKAFTLVEREGIGAMKGLTTAAIKALSTTRTLLDMYEEIEESVANFEPEPDAMAGLDWITESIETIQEMVDKGEFGNPQLQSYLEEIFSVNIGKDVKQIKDYFKKLKQYAKNEGSGFWKEVARDGGIEGLLKLNPNLSGYTLTEGTTTEQLLQAIQEQYNLTLEGAEYFLGSLTAHSLDLANQLNFNDAQSAMEEIFNTRATEMGSDQTKNVVITQSEIDTITHTYNIDDTAAKKKLKDLAKEKGLTLTVVPELVDEQGNPLTGQALTDKLKELGGEGGMDTFMIKTKVEMDDGQVQETIDYFATKELLVAMGLNEEEADEQIQAYLDEHEGTKLNIQGRLFSTTEDAQNFATSIAKDITPENFQKVVDALETALAGCNITDLITTIQTKIKEAKYEMSITGKVKLFLGDVWQWIQDNYKNINWQGVISPVGGYAKGSDGLPRDEVALTGEEGTELVQSADGTAHLVGVNGPEMAALKKGDVIYPADETKKILNGRSPKKIYRGYAKGTKGVTFNRYEDGTTGEVTYPSGNTTGTTTYPTNTKDPKDKEELKKLTALQQELNDLKEREQEIEGAIDDLMDDKVINMTRVNQLLQEKVAVQKDYINNLKEEQKYREELETKKLNEVKSKGYSGYVEYDENTQLYELTEEFYSKMFNDGVAIDPEKTQEVMDLVSELNSLSRESLATEMEIKRLVDSLKGGSADTYNAERRLVGTERRQAENDAEEELIGMLPEEIQPFFQALNTAEDASLEMQEIQANKVLAENLQQQLDASYAGVPDYIKENMTFDEYSGYGIDLAKINQIEDKEAREEMLAAVQENAKILNEQYFDPLYDVKEQLSGGKLQRAILNTGKSLQELAKEISDGDIDTGLKKINTGFKALDDALNSFIKNLEDNEAIENILSTKVLPSLSLNEEQATKLISNPKLQKALQGNVPLQNFVLQAIGTEGIDLGAILGAAFGQTGGLLEQIGGFLNFDMMKILGDGGGLIEQGKQMVEQIIGKIAEITGALINAWTNREDILYNFLQVLERYLHEYEVMQRYSTQLEKGRMASVDDIQQNWEQQWQSLQDQLEMQQERIETRQDQLDRSRWNPFQLISGWDPTSDSLYENRGVKMAFDLLISAIGMLPMGLGAFGSQLNQLYEDYDSRVQEAYEDRLAAEMAVLDIEDERLELVKIGADEATEFEQKVLDALIQKEQEQIEELSRLNDAITDANSKLISTLQKNLDQIRQDRENEKKEEELGEKERRLAYLRQDTSGANMMEIKKLEEELEEGHEDYTDTLINQKISELEKQNEAAAEQRQQQIDLLQAQLDWSQKYGLYWDAIYGMLYTIDENGNAVLNPENFDLDGNIRENSQLAKMLDTFSDRLGMSVWSSVLDNEEAKRLGRYYGAFIGNNGVSGEWADYWALLNPGADDPDYATPMPEIPDGIWGVLYKIETSIGKYFGSSNMGLWNAGERLEVGLKNILGDVFNIEEWANATAKGFHREDVIGKNTLTLMNGWNKLSEGLLGIADFGNKTSQSLTNRAGYDRHQNNGDNNISNYFNIGTVGENISLDDMVDKVSSALREVFSTGTNIVHHGR